jgi:hypothetical protein
MVAQISIGRLGSGGSVVLNVERLNPAHIRQFARSPGGAVGRSHYERRKHSGSGGEERIIKHLEDALALADELNEGSSGFL